MKRSVRAGFGKEAESKLDLKIKFHVSERARQDNGFPACTVRNITLPSMKKLSV